MLSELQGRKSMLTAPYASLLMSWLKDIIGPYVRG